jgi:hypothetical protein
MHARIAAPAPGCMGGASGCRLQSRPVVSGRHFSTDLQACSLLETTGDYFGSSLIRKRSQVRVLDRPLERPGYGIFLVCGAACSLSCGVHWRSASEMRSSAGCSPSSQAGANSKAEQASASIGGQTLVARSHNDGHLIRAYGSWHYSERAPSIWRIGASWGRPHSPALLNSGCATKLTWGRVTACE